MSADNWTQCPKCLQSQQQRDEKSRRIVANSYGKVSAEKFMEMQAAIDADRGKEPEPTLREDYEQWTDKTGVYRVSYSCSCNECGFSWRYKHEQSVLGAAK